MLIKTRPNDAAGGAPLLLRWPVITAGTAAVVLFAIFLLMRYAGTLGGMRGGMALMCLGMIALPWLLFDACGRRQIGLTLVRGLGWFPLAIVIGAAWALVCYLLGMWLFGATMEHWFVTVAQIYHTYPVQTFTVLQLHLMFTLPAILFSPIGEEIFFRGYLQKVLELRYGSSIAMWLQSGLFGLVHLLHHGMAIGVAGVSFLPASAAVWVTLMVGISLLCSWLRRASASLLPAMLAHASFNAAMNGLIFAFLWR